MHLVGDGEQVVEPVGEAEHRLREGLRRGNQPQPEVIRAITLEDSPYLPSTFGAERAQRAVPSLTISKVEVWLPNGEVKASLASLDPPLTTRTTASA